MNNLVELFCDIDDFCHQFLPRWEAQLLSDGTRKRRCKSKMSTNERMVIVIAFHQSNHRDFKNFYIGLVRRYWSEYFALINKIALNLLKNEKSIRLGVKNKRLKAGWDDDYMLKVLTVGLTTV